jgi:hypothetical protein
MSGVQAAADFLTGSILFSLSIVIIAIMVILVNNLFHKYWKPVKWQVFQPVDETTYVDPMIIEEIKESVRKKTNKSTSEESK